MITNKKLLDEVRNAVTNAQSNPTIVDLIDPYGYTLEELVQIGELCEQGRICMQTLGDTEAKNRLVSTEYQTLFKKLQRFLKRDWTIARTVLRNNPTAYELLQLGQDLDTSFVGLHVQATEFYNRLKNNPELQELLRRRGITLARIDEGSQLVQAVAAARTARLNMKGILAAVRREGKETFARLKSWMSDFCKLMPFALASQPELLASLGVNKPGPKPKKKGSKPVTPPVTEPVEPPTGRPMEETV